VETLPIEEEKEVPWMRIVLSFMGGLFFFVAIVVTESFMIERKYQKLSIAGKYRILCQQNRIILSMLGWKQEEHETLMEYRDRIAENFMPEDWIL